MDNSGRYSVVKIADVVPVRGQVAAGQRSAGYSSPSNGNRTGASTGMHSIDFVM